MAHIEKKIEVAADPHDVFGALAEIENYPRYSKYIKSVVPLAHHAYRWKAGMWGLSITWEGVVTEIEPPHYFSWHCTSGFRNRGTLRVVPHSQGSLVMFSLEYDKAPRIVGRAVAMLLKPSTDKWIARQILDSVEIYRAEADRGSA